MSAILGDYKLLSTIGKGASSKVKLAQSLETGKLFAIKIINKSNLGKDPNLSKQIKREIEIMNELDHPSIIKLHKIMESARRIYLVLDYAAGGELFEKLEKCGKFDEETCRSYFHQLIDAISYMHSRNAIHRDLKLENLLLDDEGNLKLADFGLSIIAKNLDDMLQTRCGTPYYAAPEIFFSTGYVGTSADIWSCGVILYTLFTGEFPFEGGSLEELANNIMKARVYYPPIISSQAVDLLKKIFIPDPTARITLKEIKNHPWFMKDYASNSENGSENLEIDGFDDSMTDDVEYQMVITKSYNEIKQDLEDTDSVASDDNLPEADTKNNEHHDGNDLPNAFELIAKIISSGLKNSGKENILFSVEKSRSEVYEIIDAFLDAYNAKSKSLNQNSWQISAQINLQSEVIGLDIELIGVGNNNVLVNIIKKEGTYFNFERVARAVKARLEK